MLKLGGQHVAFVQLSVSSKHAHGLINSHVSVITSVDCIGAWVIVSIRKLGKGRHSKRTAYDWL